LLVVIALPDVPESKPEEVSVVGNLDSSRDQLKLGLGVVSAAAEGREVLGVSHHAERLAGVAGELHP
jgi:hypothetical protein